MEVAQGARYCGLVEGHCSYCGKQREQVRKLIRGGGDQPLAKEPLPPVSICDECIELCVDILRDETAASMAPAPPRPIAMHRLTCVHPSGEEADVVVEIGIPYQIERDEAVCAVAIRGLDSPSRDIYGGDTFQALCLAVSFAICTLRSFVAEGGSILEPETRELIDISTFLSAVGAPGGE